MWCGHQVYRPLGKISASLLWPIRPLPSGSGFPHQPRLTFGCSCSKGPCFFLPMVLCTCWSICLKCFPLTLYLASAISFIGPHPAQMFLPQGSSSSFLAWVSCVWCAPASTAPPIVFIHSISTTRMYIHPLKTETLSAAFIARRPAPSTMHITHM